MQAWWGATFLTIVGACFVSWGIAIARLRAGRSLIAWNARQAVPWALIDLLGFALTFVLVSVLAGAALAELGWSIDEPNAGLTLADRRFKVFAIAVLPFAVLLAGLPLIAIRSGGTALDFGLSAANIGRDIELGLTAFVMLAPPVFALQAALVQIWPSEHPLMEMFKRAPDPNLFALLVGAAVLAAPLFEELVFRVLLQGFLEKVFEGRLSARELLVGTSGRGLGAGDLGLEGHLGRETQPTDVQNSVPSSTTPAPFQPSLRGRAAWLPIAISSIVFALLHWQHGPDWIPLTFLAAGMGYLYQRTHRLLPSLVVHMALNAFSMWGLWTQVRGQG